MLRIGLAMLQGARHEHIEALMHASKEIGVEIEIIELRKGSQIDSEISALILPGGESTTMRKASQSESLLDGIFDWMDKFPNRPVLGTCAGAILLSNPSEQREPYISAQISRNAWGRQRQSFEAQLHIELDTPDSSPTDELELRRDNFNHKPLKISHEAAVGDQDSYPGVFIRAPRFLNESIGCSVVAKLDDEAVGILDGMKLALTFHPELTLDRRFHRWLIANAKNNFS
ncbi:MAG: hypothetical protein DWB99_04995 [Candidatus Poseidoniales archaeon]|nr:MAG: hypothetical protein DWB99_04995 [Candidatus Poseidoniales archaeon]|tara:strand:- start:2805 stop:3494 length:690 start_codon:yes stop_codon:yes gene_type:complete